MQGTEQLMYEHLQLVREEIINEKRKRGGGGGILPPNDVPAHGRRLLGDIQRTRLQRDIGGFDDRRLLRLEINNKQAIDLLVHIPGLELVSQENEAIILAFGNEEALRIFEERLTTLVSGGSPTYKQLLYAIDAISNVEPEDRMGHALMIEGLPQDGRVDVELLPVDTRLVTFTDRAFRDWLASQSIPILDHYVRSGLMLYRLRCLQPQLEQILRYRDVRLVDLPPRLGLSRSAIQTGVNQLASPPAPPTSAVRVAVLDSGILSNHPLLAPALGDARSFVASDSPVDQDGHGTFVAGIALYGDVEAARESNSFIPPFWLLSGRLLDEHGAFDTRLIENQVEEAVRAFHEEYGCRIFNLSIGDRNRPYNGRHLRGLAFTLDVLARELGILFIVSAGNFTGRDDPDFHWLDGYPDYLLEADARIIDPAPALNAVTVGSIARYDATHQSQRHNDTIEDVPIARTDEPSPFTRFGPSVSGVIKPDFVAWGGNLSFNPRSNSQSGRGVGTLSLSAAGAGGALFAEDCGTSFAAPYITHLTGRLANLIPDASANLLRAILAVNTKYLPSWNNCRLIPMHHLAAFGYGLVDDDILYRSVDDSLTLHAEEELEDERCHFYELPIPQAFYEGSRTREIIVALSFMPATRTTRLDYKATQIEYRLVQAPDLDTVTQTFRAGSNLDNIPDVPGGTFKAVARGKGSLHCDRWSIKRTSPKRLQNRLFIVVFRKDKAWASDLSDTMERYALAVQIRDRENQNARHYAEIRQSLTIKLQQRQQVRS